MEACISCDCCGLTQKIPPRPSGARVLCAACQHDLAFTEAYRKSSARTAAASFGALVLFFPAVLLPILEVERLGYRHETSLLGGTIELLSQGDWFVGGIVLVFSLIFPLVKILLLLDLSLLGLLHERHQAATHRLMEILGRWSMLDVLLIALLVMLVKLGDLVAFRFGPAVIAFVLCVAMNLIASASFQLPSPGEEPH